MKKYFKKDKIGRAFIIYSVIFALLAICIILCFIANNKAFIWSSDAMKQHFITLKVWQEMLVNFFKTGKLNTFVWQIGGGIDLFGSFSYYIIGDFISYLSIFIPSNKLEIFYYLSILLRLYLTGITFIIYAKHKKYHNFATINGALCYTFMVYALQESFRHPYFTNALILFPLLMLGMDKIVFENKKIFYIFIIFLSYFSSFYFSYMLSICLLIYGSILIINTYHHEGLKKVINVFIKVFLCSILGILLSSVILLPLLNQFLNSNRGANTSIFSYIYSYSYYQGLIKSLSSFSMNQWVLIGMNSLALIAIPVAIKNYSKNKVQLLFLLFLFIPLIIPAIGSIFTGFSYPNNRWTFVIPFIICLFILELFENNLNFTKKDYYYIMIFNLIYFILIYYFSNIDYVIFFNIITLAIYLLIISSKQLIEKWFSKNHIFTKFNLNSFNIFITIILVLITAYRINLFYIRTNFVNSFLAYRKIEKIYNTNDYINTNFQKSIKKITSEDQDFYKIGKIQSSLFNDGLYHNYNSINYYYSIVPHNLQELGYDLSNINYYTSQEIGQFNNRSKITNLLGTKYYIASNEKSVPYGYKYLFGKDNTLVYENEYPISFVQYYDYYILDNEYEDLSNIEKESSLLKTVSLNKDISKKDLNYYKNIKTDINQNIQKLDYSIIPSASKITISNLANNKISIKLPDKEIKGELYLKIDNIKYEPFSKKELYDIKVKKEKMDDIIFNQTYDHYQKTNQFAINIIYNDEQYTKNFMDNRIDSYSSGDNNILINLGLVNTKDLDEISIKLLNLGTYSYDNLELLLVTFDDYEEDINNLNRSNYQTIKYKNGYMKGTVDLEKPGIIQFATSYVDGWELYVDGQKSELLNVNKYFLGTYMAKGKHTIELKYHTPLLKEGLLITIISGVIYLIVIIFEIKKSQKVIKC